MLTVCKDLQDVTSIFRHCTYKTLWNTFDSCNNYQMPKGTIRFPGNHGSEELCEGY